MVYIYILYENRMSEVLYIYIWRYKEYRGDVCMYVCMYVRMYVCLYVCMYACMHACMHGWMDGSLSLYIYIYVHNIHGGICEEYVVNIWDKSFKYERIIKQTYTVYIYIYKYIQIYTNIYKYIQIYTNIYKYIQIYTNIYKYIYKYIQIHGITGGKYDKCWTSGINAELIWTMTWRIWPFWHMTSTNTGDFTEQGDLGRLVPVGHGKSAFFHR